MLLMQLFACAALVLAGVGVYAVAAFAVSRRVREIGTRLALGATRGSIVWMVVRQELALAAAGTAFGAAGALAAGRLLRAQVSAVHSGNDAGLWIAIAVAAGAVALGSLQPALRAGGLDPLDALRRE
jgi:ABC-type antimicrobial peptide transport system permease subunit